jgi:preprotein translocase subunit SecE
VTGKGGDARGRAVVLESTFLMTILYFFVDTIMSMHMQLREK